ncbi:MAG: DUF899 domain-containing protein [Pseudomonadota bacterium]
MDTAPESAGPTIASREDWLAARRALLAEEKALTHAREALAAKRRALPWVRVDAAYAFETPEGPCGLADLFGTSRQLIVQHFMFGRDWAEGCVSCSFWADGFNGLTAHLAARDTAFALVSTAPLATIEAYRARMGWDLRWVSDSGGDAGSFSADFGVSFPADAGPLPYNFGTGTFSGTDAPGISVFARRGGEVFHSYSTYARGLDMLNATYHLLDLTPNGRDEDDLPWTMAWLRRHDAY